MSACALLLKLLIFHPDLEVRDARLAIDLIASELKLGEVIDFPIGSLRLTILFNENKHLLAERSAWGTRVEKIRE